MKANEEKAAYWFGHVKTYRESGLTQQEYTRREGLAHGTFKYWLYKERQKHHEGSAGREKSSTFKELTLLPPVTFGGSSHPYTIRTVNGEALSFSESADLGKVSQLLAMLSKKQ